MKPSDQPVICEDFFNERILKTERDLRDEEIKTNNRKVVRDDKSCKIRARCLLVLL